MPSFASYLFDRHAVDVLMDTFADVEVRLSVRTGTDELVDIEGIVRARSVAMEADEAGGIHRVERRSVVVASGENCPCKWGIVADPQLKTVWTLTDIDGNTTEWGVDNSDGRAVESLSESLAVIHLVRHQAMTRSFAGYRE